MYFLSYIHQYLRVYYELTMWPAPSWLDNSAGTVFWPQYILWQGIKWLFFNAFSCYTIEYPTCHFSWLKVSCVFPQNTRDYDRPLERVAELVYIFEKLRITCWYMLAARIWKRGYLSTVRPTVHTQPSLKRSFLNRRNFKTLPFCRCVDGKHFENRIFPNRVRIIVWSPAQTELPKTQIQNSTNHNRWLIRC